MHRFVYTWGRNQADQLGHGISGNNIRTPTKILKDIDGNVFSGVSQCSAGLSLNYGFSICVTMGGDVYTFGHGEKDALGHGRPWGTRPRKKAASYNRPKKVEALNQIAIQHCSAGENHVVCVAVSGTVYSWGADGHMYRDRPDGPYGFLGQGDGILCPSYIR